MPEVKKVRNVSSRLYKTPVLPDDVLAKKKERKVLESKRYDVSMYDYPETHWEFYDTFLDCDITKMGTIKGEPTTADLEEDDGKTEKYIRKAVAIRKEARIPIIPPKEEPPEPYRSLMYLVGSEGRWTNVKHVKKILRLPRHARLTTTTREWEAATAFALAAMRQAYEYFHLLGDVFDKGTSWLTSEQVLYEAKRVLNELQHTEEIPGYESPVDEFKEIKEDAEEDEGNEGSSVEKTELAEEKSSLEEEARDSINQLSLDTGMDGAKTLMNTHRTQDGGGDAGAMSVVATPTTPSLAEKMRAITPQVDKRRQSSMNAHINKLLNDIFSMSTDLDRHREDIKTLLDKSVTAYNACETHTERTYVFLELTAMIADGEPPRKGLPPDDWRSRGVIGYRPKAIALLCKVMELAEARLEMEEIELPGGRSAAAATEYVPAGNRYRWTVIWDGDDIVAKVLHSLDFLRKSKEFKQWYGRTYLFLCNPLALSFDVGNGWTSLGMDTKVNEHIMTRPHFRHVKFTEHDWQHQKFLWKWKESLLELSSGRWGWWPALPVLKEESDQHKLYVAMLVLLIKCQEEMVKFSKYEGELVSYESTARGQGVGPKADIRDLVFFMPKRPEPVSEDEEDDLEAAYMGVDLPSDTNAEQEKKDEIVTGGNDKDAETAQAQKDAKERSGLVDKGVKQRAARSGMVAQRDNVRRASVQKMASRVHSSVRKGLPKDWKNSQMGGTASNKVEESITEEQVFKEGDEKALREAAESSQRGPGVRLRKASTMQVSTKNLRLMGKGDSKDDDTPMVKKRSTTGGSLGAVSEQGSKELSVTSKDGASQASGKSEGNNSNKSVAKDKKPTSPGKGKRRPSRRGSTLGSPKGKKSQDGDLLKDKEKLTEALKDSRAVTRAKPEGRRMTKRASESIK